MERDLATARRALYRCKETAERGAYHGIEDALYPILEETALLMECVIRGKEAPSPRAA